MSNRPTSLKSVEREIEQARSELKFLSQWEEAHAADLADARLDILEAEARLRRLLDLAQYLQPATKA